MVDRNIITEADLRLRRTKTRGGAPSASESADDYLSKVAKQVPFEVISAYLVLEGVIRSGNDRSPHLFVLLVTAFVLGVVGSIAFAWSVLAVHRKSQLLMTGFAFSVWVFATGGWFSFTSWHQPWMGSAAVVVFAMVVRVTRVPPLPEASE